MEQYTDAMQMIDLMDRPAFCVRDGIIVKINDDAERFMIEEGTPVSKYLQTGAEEYAAFRDGCLYLNLTVCGRSLGFSVTRKAGFDVFRLEQDDDNSAFQVMALAARELREPLSGIMHMAKDLIPASALESDPHAREQAEQFNRRLYQMLRLIGNMSDAERYTTAGSGHQEIRDICAVVEEIFDKAAALTEHTGVRLTYTGHPESIYCLTDSEKLENAILNIISNALKFTEKGGTIDAKLTRLGSKLYLSVQDSGHGISDSVRGNLFSRYSRQPGIEDGRYGIGLGMVLIHSAATLHGGTVLIDQPTGTGTRITMTLAIRRNTDGMVRSPFIGMDRTGEHDPALVAMADVLPAHLYDPESI